MLHIFTLTWNNSEKLAKLYASLLPALDGIDYQWWIKNNDSKDDTIDKVTSWENNKVNLLNYKDNRQNFSAGCNYLYNASHSDDQDLILLLNNDVVFNDTTSIQNMINIINADNQVGVVGGRLLYTDTNKLQHAGVVFDPQYKTPMHFRANQQSDANAEQNRLFQCVTGAVALTKAEYFKNVCTTNKSGSLGMDENYHWAFDDVDLCLSIKYNMNKKIVYCGNTNIFHEESASLKKNPANKLFLNHNIHYLLKKWDKKYVIDRDAYTKDARYNLYRNPNLT